MTSILPPETTPEAVRETSTGVRPVDGSKIARDSMFLVLTSGLTALVGMVFWVLAARTLTPARLGVDAAMISAVTAAATVAATGVANAFLSSIPLSGPGRAELIRLGYGIVLAAALVTGVVSGVLVVTVLHGGPAWPTVPLITGATVVWSFFIVQDPVLAATGRARWLLVENLPVNAAKLALLPVLGLLLTHPALLAMILPAAVAVIVVSGVLIPRFARPDAVDAELGREYPGQTGAHWIKDNRRKIGLFILRDGTGSALSLGLWMALPFLVTATAGPEQGAVFVLCAQVAMGLELVTAGIAQSLTTNAAGDPRGALAVAWRVLRRMVALVGVALIGLLLLGHLVLRLFGQSYVDAGGWSVLAVLAVGALFQCSFEVWTALMRVWHLTTAILVANVVGALVIIPAVWFGAHDFGALGAAVGLTGGQLLMGAIGLVGLLREGRRLPR